MDRKRRTEIFSASVKGDAAYNKARRHSRRVRFLKIALPVAAGAIALVFGLFTYFATSGSTPVVTLNGEDGYSNVMTTPKLEGYTSDGKPYALTAAKAVQVPGQDGIIELEKIRAKLPLGNRGEAVVQAEAGVFDNINGRLQLTRPFVVETSDGMKAWLQSADVNVKTSQLTTRSKVEIRRPGELLTANSMRILENGRRILFEGKVKLVINRAMAQ